MDKPVRPAAAGADDKVDELLPVQRMQRRLADPLIVPRRSFRVHGEGDKRVHRVFRHQGVRNLCKQAVDFRAVFRAVGMDLLIDEGAPTWLAVGEAYSLDLIEVRELVAVGGPSVVVRVLVNDDAARFRERAGLNRAERPGANALRFDIDPLFEELTRGNTAT